MQFAMGVYRTGYRSYLKKAEIAVGNLVLHPGEATRFCSAPDLGASPPFCPGGFPARGLIRSHCVRSFAYLSKVS